MEQLSTSQRTGKEEMPQALVPGVGEHVGVCRRFPRLLLLVDLSPASGIMEKELAIPPARGPPSDQNVSKKPEVLRREGIE